MTEDLVEHLKEQAMTEAPEKNLDSIIVWRDDQLRKGGFDANQSMLLAEKSYVDIHEACELVKQGCPPDQAVLILS